MIYLKTFENYRFDNILYHGSDVEHKFDTRGYITDGTFFSEDINVARDYGKYVYQVVIKDVPIFDTTDIKDITELFDAFDELFDRYSETYISDPNGFIHSSDTWDPIENTDGVINWLKAEGYHGVRIIEGGSESNILLFYPSEDIMKYNLKN